MKLSLRIINNNINHNIWLNNGTWYIDYTIHPTEITKERIRHSLKTKDVTKARIARDMVFLNAVKKYELDSKIQEESKREEWKRKKSSALSKLPKEIREKYE